MHPLHEAEKTTQMRRLLEKNERHNRAREAGSVETIMIQLRPEIEALVQELMTAHLVRRSNNEPDTAIAENYVDILRRVDYKIIQDTLWNMNGFWYRLSSLLTTEAIEPSATDDTYPKDKSVQLKYDLNYVIREIPTILEIVKKELQDETR